MYFDPKVLDSSYVNTPKSVLHMRYLHPKQEILKARVIPLSEISWYFSMTGCNPSLRDDPYEPASCGLTPTSNF